jgi:hypothetical protein
VGFRNKIKDLAVSTGLFASDEGAGAPPASPADEDPLADMERLVAESRARVQPPTPPISFEPPRQAPPPIRPAAPGAPPGAPAREVALEIPGPPSMLSIEEVYQKSKLNPSPETGTVLKIIVLTADPNLAALPRPTKAAMVRASLAADRVTPEQVVDDAIQRDRALDSARDFLQKRVVDFRERATAKVAEIEAERERMLQEFNDRIASLRQAANAAEDEYSAWLRQKRDIERGLFEAVAMVIPGGVVNPISLDEVSGAPREPAVPPQGGAPQ